MRISMNSLASGSRFPRLPKPDGDGNVPALEYVRASIARDIIRERKGLGTEARSETPKRRNVEIHLTIIGPSHEWGGLETTATAAGGLRVRHKLPEKKRSCVVLHGRP